MGSRGPHGPAGCSDLTAIERAELGQLGDRGERQSAPAAAHGHQKIDRFLQVLMRSDMGVDRFVQFFQLIFEKRNHIGDDIARFFIIEMLELLLADRNVLDQLPAAGEQLR